MRSMDTATLSSPALTLPTSQPSRSWISAQSTGHITCRGLAFAELSSVNLPKKTSPQDSFRNSGNSCISVKVGLPNLTSNLTVRRKPEFSVEKPHILNMATVPGQLVETFRPIGVALKSLQIHWKSLHFLQSPSGGTPYRPPRMWRSPGNLTVSRNR